MILRTGELLVLLLHNFTYSVITSPTCSIGRGGGTVALSYPPIVIDDSSWKNAAESFTVALTLTLGGLRKCNSAVDRVLGANIIRY